MAQRARHSLTRLPVTMLRISLTPDGGRQQTAVDRFTRTLETGDEPMTVTERRNAATEERLKSGHAVGAVSIL
jgi:hypothetical protein